MKKKELLEDIFHKILYYFLGNFLLLVGGFFTSFLFRHSSFLSFTTLKNKTYTPSILPWLLLLLLPFSNQIQSRINCIYDRERFIIKISFRFGENGNSRKILKLKRWMKRKNILERGSEIREERENERKRAQKYTKNEEWSSPMCSDANRVKFAEQIENEI